MDYSKKVNANAGKGARYSPGAVSQNFGEPNMVAAGAGISSEARIRTQEHGSGIASGSQPKTDRAGVKPTIAAPGMSTDNFGQHPAGVSGPSRAIAGQGITVTAERPGDANPGRRGSPPKGGKAPDRYRGRSM